MHFVVLAQVLGGANAGISGFNKEFSTLGVTVLETAVLFMGMLIISSVGSTGIQKHLRSAIFIIGLGALFFKGYVGIATGAMAMF